MGTALAIAACVVGAVAIGLGIRKALRQPVHDPCRHLTDADRFVAAGRGVVIDRCGENCSCRGPAATSAPFSPRDRGGVHEGRTN